MLDGLQSNPKRPQTALEEKRAWFTGPTEDTPMDDLDKAIADGFGFAPKDNPKHIQAMKDGKAPLEYLIASVNPGEARVLKGGAEKYGVKNWLIDKILATTYIGAIRRHLDEWAEGTDTDKDSGENPLQHIRACCGIVMDAEKHGMLVDDRDRAESIDRSASIGWTFKENLEPNFTTLDNKAPLYVVMCTNFEGRTDLGDPIIATKSYGPFPGYLAASTFAKLMKGQMPGTFTLNELTPAGEIENVRDRDQEIDDINSGADSSDAHREVAGDAARIREDFRQRAIKHASDSPVRLKESPGSRSK